MALVGFGGDPIGRAEVEMREGKIKNGNRNCFGRGEQCEMRKGGELQQNKG